ncbi:TPA: exopolysaccharide biosynthesis protein VpsH [Vibrio cholerae]|uniref:exopolysaccharide biosynthesis protein VpsH n=1 Tax=Vibrio cholerae TaxID=666 RepID=UPI000B49231B|nr:exopolysaccharide biosynthesis protein VpsH [Vibrio cholerae]EGR2467505.1 phenylacetate--CoA ligase family protein [Vibrio cholerae]ELY5180799.1 exopolysaccharide biosynthesis protein VpsH [Vibrio cholerae]KAA1197549.1 phenylacetate--CoA ligase family protein [Vibrio cholerae]KAA1205026.1 phenylacetate--CoA ligase family protein [Vibrio cholerae]KAA1208952.1 phenylacetate--CoA ligase family protein [Vibrio cholerae]
MFTSSLYVRAPIWLQNIMLSVRALSRKLVRENGEMRAVLKEIQANEYSKTQLAKYQQQQLQRVLENACQNVLFYGRLGLANSPIQAFPYLDKTVLRSEHEQFISQMKPSVVVKGATSGTTGTPLTILQDMRSVIREQAFIARQLSWAGYRQGDKRAWIRGDMVVPLSQKQGPFWRYSWFEQMIVLSSFHLTPQAMPNYLQAMVDFGVDIIQAYPSSIAALARYLEANQTYYPAKLKSIITSSESLSEEDRQVIETRFKCKIFDWYGLFERVAAIGECEHHRYHLLTDYSQVELLDAGQDRYELVGTNFNNHYFPLIRYKTGDHVHLSENEACPCGRVFPVIKRIEGRVGDYLVGEDGQKIHILNHIPKGVNGLLATQFLQKDVNKITVLVVVESRVFDMTQEEVLIKNTKDRIGKNICVEIVKVDSIPKTKNGKTRQAICLI